jgi:hypothetical protein
MRFSWILGALGLFAAVPSFAKQGAANTLTPQEISSGWILLFDGETQYGWTSAGDAKWSVVDGNLQASKGGKGFLKTNAEFGSYELKFDVWIDAKAAAGSGSIAGIGKKNKFAGKWSAFDVLADGDHLLVKVGGKKAIEAHNRRGEREPVALEYGGAGIEKFKNVKLKPLGLKSIFNGKDLTGWKEIPDHKSVFSVTPEGLLNVKNGNGDLQTEAKWGDFVLQIDVYSNGDHLNSGVFFRANPGLFWSGYEDQIRNQWQGDDRTKAFDYGTGAIYNRLPARKVVSSDREWFKMTLVADGKHLSSWVNGYLVADFQDERPENQGNARLGARTAPGVISIQGHDPTTDLSFKNIQVVELPLAKP